MTRFPPEPNGYLHIGHAKAAIIDSEYARLYDGKFILRFDDTNPDNALLEFYDAQKEDLHWLGIEWDSEYHTSDNLQTHYKLAEQLISQKMPMSANVPLRLSEKDGSMGNYVPVENNIQEQTGWTSGSKCWHPQNIPGSFDYMEK